MNLISYTPADWPAVEDIYWQGIRTKVATFATSPVPQAEFEAKALQGTFYVSKDSDGTVTGWACLWATSTRACYRGVVEVSVYVAEDQRGKGTGLALLEKINEVSEALGFWTLQAAIGTNNKASIKVHEKAGYRAVGVREKIAQTDGVWLDTLLMERRSSVVGT